MTCMFLKVRKTNLDKPNKFNGLNNFQRLCFLLYLKTTFEDKRNYVWIKLQSDFYPESARRKNEGN